jgi:2TM domain
MSMNEAKPKRKRDEFVDDYDDAPRRLTQAWNFFVRVLAFCTNNLLIAPLRWIWRQSMSLLRFTWDVSFAVLRWSWRITGRMLSFTFDKSLKTIVWTARAPFRFLGWTWNWLFGGPEPDDPMQALRWRIKRRYRRRNRFITHVFAYFTMNGYLWLTYNPTYYYPDEPLRSTPALFTLFWGVVLFFHFIRMRMGDAEDSAMEAALQRQTTWETPYVVEDEVIYDERYARLTDDEMLDYPVDERLKQKRKRG